MCRAFSERLPLSGCDCHGQNGPYAGALRAGLKERKSEAMLVNRRTLRIEWGQCDPAGIVFYPQYLIIFDTSTGWLFERSGLSPLAMRKKYGIVGMPIVEVGARFVTPCRFDDDVTIESDVGEWGRSSFTVRHRVVKESKLAVEGFEKRVWAGPDPDRPGAIQARPIPAEIIASLSDPTGATTVASDETRQA